MAFTCPGDIPSGYAHYPRQSDVNRLPLSVQAQLLEMERKEHPGYNLLLDRQLSDSRKSNSEWCHCGKKCKTDTLTYIREYFCCTEHTGIASKVQTEGSANMQCITQLGDFEEQCLNQKILERCSQHYSVGRGDRIIETFDTSDSDHKKALRFAAYTSFTLWAHGKMGFGNRGEIPACVASAIRTKFPADDGMYVPFTPYEHTAE